ncbi:hypothetical protein ANCDUO_24586 [Ancylostoma duodenale]|uniref:Uncharacterized protein n=1 Tax=Ancylostoma duodenale TaxID=51022 RepID=A0A0C2BNJ0_9BILA|nr:hypothetical protein ANCDUO_24586 [Ancylostoma duodenale]
MLKSEASIDDLVMQAKKIRTNRDEMTPAIECQLRHWRRTVPCNLRQQKSWSWCPRKHELGREHRLVRTANNPNRTFAVEKMWINTDNLCRLRSNIQLGRRRY